MSVRLPLPTSLERIEVRSATFRDASGDERVRVAQRLRELSSAEAVLIDTCHRVELVSVDVRAGAPPGQYRGAEAVHRVFDVVAGFDSAVVAEEQLLGQVRDAYEDALVSGRTGPTLNELMRRALRFGRLVRSHARPGTDRSLGDPALAWLRERLPMGARVIVAGTGKMGHLLASRLAEAGHPVTVVSASAERGSHLLSSLPDGDHHLAVGPITLELLRACAGVALAVRSRTPALTTDMLGGGTAPWVVDLSAPSTVERAAASRLGDRLLDVDHLGAEAGRRSVLSPASDARLRRQLADEVHSFVAWFAARQGADALTLLHREADSVRRRHLERLRRRGALDDRQLAAVEATSAAMIGELLHGPTIELRQGGADAATVRRLFRIEA